MDEGGEEDRKLSHPCRELDFVSSSFFSNGNGAGKRNENSSKRNTTIVTPEKTKISLCIYFRVHCLEFL